jgi:hypothetical protein
MMKKSTRIECVYNIHRVQSIENMDMYVADGVFRVKQVEKK